MSNKKLIEGFHNKGFLMTYVAIGIIAIVATFVYGPSLKISADVSTGGITCTGPTSAEIIGTCIESQPQTSGISTEVIFGPLCSSGTSQRSWCNQATGRCVKVTANCTTGTCNGNYCSGPTTSSSNASGYVDCCGNGKCDQVTTAQVGSCKAESASTCPADCSGSGTPPTPPAPVRPTVVTPPVPPGPTSTSVTPPTPPGPQTETAVPPVPQTPTPTTATPTPEPTVSAYVTDTPTPGPTVTTFITETPTPEPTVTAYTTATAVKTAPPVIQITATPVIVPISAPSSPATEYIVSGITSGISFALTIIVVILIGGVIIFRIITKKD